MAAGAVDEATTRDLADRRGRRGGRHDGHLDNIALRRNEPFAGRAPGSVKVHRVDSWKWVDPGGNPVINETTPSGSQINQISI